jgi:hypothetical protein
MTWLFVLAAFMAIFGVIGYLRGWRAALLILFLTLLAVAITGALGDTIIRYINAFGKGFRFLLSGGLNALTGEGSADEALAALRDSPPFVAPENETLVLGMLFVIVVLLAVLFSALPWFKGSRSIFGLFLGLFAGYIVSAMIVRAVLPEYAALVPLPFGFGPAVPVGPIVVQPGQPGPSLSQRILSFLTGLADRGLIAAFLGLLIAIFLLAATRAGNRTVKKG